MPGGYVQDHGARPAQDGMAGAISTSITRTTSTKITSITSIEGAIGLTLTKAENGSTMHSIAVALLTETETRLTSMVVALDNRPA